jgi:phage shock protein A
LFNFEHHSKLFLFISADFHHGLLERNIVLESLDPREIAARYTAETLGTGYPEWMSEMAVRAGKTQEKLRTAVEQTRQRLAELRAPAVRVIAAEYQVERALVAAREKLARVDVEAQGAEGQKWDELLAKRRVCEAHVGEIEARLADARRDAAEARQQIEMLKDAISQAADRAREARVHYQLATVKARLEQLAADSAFEKGLLEIEGMERKALSAQAEAEAIAELNAAMGYNQGPGAGGRGPGKGPSA